MVPERYTTQGTAAPYVSEGIYTDPALLPREQALALLIAFSLVAWVVIIAGGMWLYHHLFG